jgi:hypothetical protein
MKTISRHEKRVAMRIKGGNLGLPASSFFAGFAPVREILVSRKSAKAQRQQRPELNPCLALALAGSYTLQEKDLPQISRITRITAFICVIGGICGENSFS